MNPQVFINYRRDDSGPEALLLRNQLNQKFGDGFAFLDHHSIKPGEKWAAELESKLHTAKLVLVLIGSEWLTITDGSGRRRIDDESDWVRRELETTIKEKKEWIIVLVRGAEVPASEALPESLSQLPERQDFSIRSEYWDNDVKPLLEQIERDPLYKIDLNRLFDEPTRKSETPVPNIQPEADRRTRKMLVNVMDQLEKDWIKDVLDRSLQHAAWMELKLDWQKDKVETAANKRRISGDHSIRSLKSEENIASLFKEAGRQLLILGEPGAGKTTVLLKLAKIFLIRAREDVNEPIPVALPLNAWTGKHRNFQEWFGATFHEWYHVPPTVGREWLNEGRLLLLLDGLDEVSAEFRENCVAAINAFGREMGVRLPGIVVTCRYGEYEALTQKLKLDEAICLGPLSPNQIDQYLADGGPKLALLRDTLREDAVLADLAQSPFMLVVCILAYSGQAPPTAVGGSGASLEERRRQIFKDYVDSAFRRPDKPSGKWSDDEILNWLRKLARQMIARSTKFFALETLQPAWLESRRLHLLYILITRSAGTVFIGLFALLIGRMLPTYSFKHSEPLSTLPTWLVWFPACWIAIASICLAASDYLAMKWRPTVRLFAILGACVLAVTLSEITLTVLTSGLSFREPDYFGRQLFWSLLAFCFAAPKSVYAADVTLSTGLGWSWRDALRRTAWTSGVIAAILFTILIGIDLATTGLEMGPTFWCFIGGACGGGTLAMILHRRQKKRIKFTTLLFAALLVVLGSFFGMSIGILFDEDASLTETLIFPWIVGGEIAVFWPLFAGLKLKMTSTIRTARPGAWYWFKRPLMTAGLAVAIVFGFLLVVIAAVFSYFLIFLSEGEADWSQVFESAVWLQVLLTTGALSLMFGLIGFFRFGGLNWLQHRLLCFLMVRSGRLPRASEKFLDYASKLILLRKRGSNYEFIHATFLDYIAMLPEANMDGNENRVEGG